MTSDSKITPQITRQNADLSRLRSNPDQDFLEKYTDSLNKIVKVFEELQSVDTSDVSATAIIKTIRIKDLRADEPDGDKAKYESKRKKIIANFPKSQGNFLVLPIRIIE